MIELLWFAAGAAVPTAAAALLLPRRRRARAITAPPPRPSEPSSQAPLPGITAETQRIAVAISEELATLVSGVDGAAHDLIERAPEREHLPRAAEQLIAAIHRLRTLHQKLRAFGAEDIPSPGAANVAEVTDSLTDELQHLRLGLEVETRFAPDLPMVGLPPDALRNVLLFACAAMLRSESGAAHLSIVAERSLGDDETALRIELLLEWPGDPGRTPGRTTHDPRVAIAVEAATRLARRHGAEVTLSYPPGRAVKTLIVLPATRTPAVVEESVEEPVPAPAPPQAQPHDQRPRHRFGGALVVETDPAVRSMLARELRHAGRAVFACADGAAARTFLEATPDRFEMLFVDHHERLDHKDELGRAVRRLAPSLKVCVLAAQKSPPSSQWPDLRCIEKPFSVHELRRALASVLDAG
ncbi:MAG: hypothetical protein KDC98_00800 [Planctomycetes bacterium]|nr:hypothetical protein [Planctomycetota bacterium]